MPNSVILQPRAEKFLRKLKDRSLYRRIMDVLVVLRNNPLPQGTKKLSGSDDSYRIRVGDYRIVYRVEANCIRVGKIAHRREIYR